MLMLMLDEARMIGNGYMLSEITCDFIFDYVFNCLSKAEDRCTFKRPEVKLSRGEFVASDVFGGKDADYNF